MPDSANITQIADKLASSWQRQRGEALQVTEFLPLSAGASASSFRLGGHSQSGPIEAVLQLANGGAVFGVALDKHAQAQVQQRAAQCGIRTPEVLLSVGAEDGLAHGFVSRFFAGETLGRRIVRHADYTPMHGLLTQDCAQALAQIHAMDVAGFSELVPRDAAKQCAELADLHRSFGEHLPVFEAAFIWLQDQQPTNVENVVVHGDFRVGNLLVTPQGLAAVLDWELAHIGDPMEDLGWLCMRSWRFGQTDKPVGGFAQRADFYAAYEQISSRRVDPERVRYWELLGCLKWGIICQWFAQQSRDGVMPGLEPALTGRRVSEVQLQILDLLQGRGY